MGVPFTVEFGGFEPGDLLLEIVSGLSFPLRGPDDVVRDGLAPRLERLVVRILPLLGALRLDVVHDRIAPDAGSVHGQGDGNGSGKPGGPNSVRPSRGLFILPEINDEVLVAFEHGDMTRPFVIGALWNSMDKPPKTNSEVTGDNVVNERLWKTRAGHTISLDDTNGSEKITIADKTGNNKITIESSSNKISINADGDIALDAKGKVEVTAATDVNVTAQGNAKVTTTGNTEVSATGKVSISGTSDVSISSSGNLELKGTAVTVEGSGSLSLKSSGVTTVQGSLVNIN